MPDLFAVLKFNEDYTIKSANLLARRLLGIDSADPSTFKLTDFCIEEYPNWDSLLDSGQSQVTDDIATRDILMSPLRGTPFWARANLALRSRDGGRLFTPEMAFVSIDDHVRENSSGASYGLIVDRLHTLGKRVCYIRNEETKQYLFISSNVTALLGFSPEEVYTNKNGFWDFVHEDDYDNVYKIQMSAIEKSQPYEIEYRCVREGKEIWVHHIAEPLVTKCKKNKMYLSSVADITDKKRKDRVISHMEGVKNIAVITADLAHNFNNILSVISLNCGLIARGRLEREVIEKRIGVILKVAQRAKDITTALMAIARIQNLQPQVLDLNSAIASMEDLIAASAGPSIQICYNLTEISCPVLLDISGLHQALFNLLVNSRQAMTAGGTITISTSVKRCDCPSRVDSEHDLKAVDYIELTVADDGPGMTADVLEHALEPYFTTKKADGGSGIGLAATNGFIAQSGGVLKLESVPNCGLTVRMFLPIASTEDGDTGNSVLGKETRKLRALVVDDDIDLLENLSEALAIAGIECEPTSTIDKAIGLAERGSYDLLISDIALSSPRDGLDLIELFARQWPVTTVLLMSGYTAYNAEIPSNVSFMSKPFQIEELYSRIKTLFPAYHLLV